MLYEVITASEQLIRRLRVAGEVAGQEQPGHRHATDQVAEGQLEEREVAAEADQAKESLLRLEVLAQQQSYNFV